MRSTEVRISLIVLAALLLGGSLALIGAGERKEANDSGQPVASVGTSQVEPSVRLSEAVEGDAHLQDEAIARLELDDGNAHLVADAGSNRGISGAQLFGSNGLVLSADDVGVVSIADIDDLEGAYAWAEGYLPRRIEGLVTYLQRDPGIKVSVLTGSSGSDTQEIQVSRFSEREFPPGSPGESILREIDGKVYSVTEPSILIPGWPSFDRLVVRAQNRSGASGGDRILGCTGGVLHQREVHIDLRRVPTTELWFSADDGSPLANRPTTVRSGWATVETVTDDGGRVEVRMKPRAGSVPYFSIAMNIAEGWEFVDLMGLDGGVGRTRAPGLDFSYSVEGNWRGKLEVALAAAMSPDNRGARYGLSPSELDELDWIVVGPSGSGKFLRGTVGESTCAVLRDMSSKQVLDFKLAYSGFPTVLSTAGSSNLRLENERYEKESWAYRLTPHVAGSGPNQPLPLAEPIFGIVDDAQCSLEVLPGWYMLEVSLAPDVWESIDVLEVPPDSNVYHGFSAAAPKPVIVSVVDPMGRPVADVVLDFFAGNRAVCVRPVDLHGRYAGLVPSEVSRVRFRYKNTPGSWVDERGAHPGVGEPVQVGQGEEVVLTSQFSWLIFDNLPQPKARKTYERYILMVYNGEGRRLVRVPLSGMSSMRVLIPSGSYTYGISDYASTGRMFPTPRVEVAAGETKRVDFGKTVCEAISYLTIRYVAEDRAEPSFLVRISHPEVGLIHQQTLKLDTSYRRAALAVPSELGSLRVQALRKNVDGESEEVLAEYEVELRDSEETLLELTVLSGGTILATH